MIFDCMPVCHYYTYSTTKGQRRSEKAHRELDKLHMLLDKFARLRNLIFELRADAEDIDLGLVTNSAYKSIAEFNLIYPVIKKLSDTAEFINDREYREWELEVEAQEKEKRTK